MINENFITNLIQTKFNITPTSISKLDTIGIMNMVYLVEFNNRKLIIRLRENDSYAENEFEKEKWFSKQCAKLEIPVPRIMYTGQYNNIDYLIEEYINGISGNNYTDRKFIFKKLGEYSKKIKSIPIHGYGLTISDFDTNTFVDELYSSPIEQITQNIECINLEDKLLKMNIYDSKYINNIKKSFSSLLDSDHNCYLNHGDISLSNCIVTPERKVYWIDFGSVNSNLILNEFANVKTSSPQDLISFMEGFGLDFKKINSELVSYRLLNSFDKLRWSLTSNNPDYIKWYSENAKKNFTIFKSEIHSYEK